MPLEGSQLGRYHLIRLFGRGDMGEVYLAEDMGINRQVAIKVIRSDVNLDPGIDTASEATRLFQHEMRTIARLNHPHILPLFDYGEAIIKGFISQLASGSSSAVKTGPNQSNLVGALARGS